MKRLCRESDRGAAVVEFALVFMLFIGLVLMVFEGGRLLVMQASLGSAARDAARVMSISGDAVKAQERADDAFVFGTPVWDINVPCPATPDSNASAKASFIFETQLVTGIVDMPVTLRGSGAMRCNG